MPASWRVYIDWANNGTFTDPRDDVTSRILDGRTPVTIRTGRDQARAGAPTAGGESRFELNNDSRDYSPENASSPLAGQVRPGRPTRIVGTLAGVPRILATHYLDDFTVLPARDTRSVAVEAIDGLARLRGTPVTTSLMQSIRTGDAITMILDAAGWPAALRDIDPGATVMPWWWLSAADAADAITQLVDSEGQPAVVVVEADGVFTFHDRHHRHFNAASTTTQSTWRSSGTVEPLVSAPAEYDHGWKEIVNSVTFEVAVRRPDAQRIVVWSTDAVFALENGETKEIAASSSTPFLSATVPWAGVDFVLQSGAVTVALSQRSGDSTTIAVRAVGGPAVVVGMQLRAVAVPVASTVVVSVEDTASIAAYGRCGLSSDRAPVWANTYDALAIAQILVGRRAERLPAVSVTMLGTADARLLQQMTRRISDRVRVVETQTGLDADCFVEQIAHTITQGGLEVRTVFGLEKAPAPVTSPFTFDVAGRGFNDGRFVRVGHDDPGTMFRFDVAGRGFNDGVFAH